MSQRLKIAVIGSGAIVERAHPPGLVSDGEVAIFLCVRNSERLSELSSRFSIKKTFSSFEECLQSVPLDAAIIATPNFLHGEDAFRAISFGLPLLLEKPVSHDIAMSREIASRTGQVGVPIHLNLPQPLRPSMHLVKAAIDEGRFGQIRSIGVTMLRSRPSQASGHGLPRNGFPAVVCLRIMARTGGKGDGLSKGMAVAEIIAQAYDEAH